MALKKKGTPTPIEIVKEPKEKKEKK